MKYTLLQLVQLVASSTDSDQVNSIADSTESMQIANIVRTVYYDIINRANLPEHFSMVTLDPSNDSTKPTLMYIPANVENIYWVKYNNLITLDDPMTFADVMFVDLKTFFDRMEFINTDSDTNVGSYTITIGPDTFTILYINDKPPNYYTTFNDNTLIFDSYNSVVEATLQKSNTLAYGRLVIPFTMADNFTPNLDDAQFTLLLNEAKALAWAELKQTTHSIAERNSKRAWTTSANQKHASEHLSDFDKLPYYGRR